MTWRHVCAILGVFALALVTTGCNCCHKACRQSACMPAPGPGCCPAPGAPAAPAPAQAFYSGPAPAPCCNGN